MIVRTPYMLLLLLILPILGNLLARARRLQNETAETLRGKAPVSKGWKLRMALQLCAFAALIVALAQPAWNPRPGPMSVQGRDLVIALDISRSMLADDVFPSRLDGARIALYESLDQLRGQRLGLITFAGSARMRVPLTLDHNFFRYILENSSPSDASYGGSSLQAVVEKAIDVAFNEAENGKQDIILFTDGDDNLSDLDRTAEQLRESGVRVLLIGLGDAKVSSTIPSIDDPTVWMQHKGSNVLTRLEGDTLQALAEQSPNVTYYAAETLPFNLVELYRQMITDNTDVPLLDETQLIYTEGYPFFIALALLLAFVPLKKRMIPALAVVLIAGCTPDAPEPPEPENSFYEQMLQSLDLQADAQALTESDPRAALSVLIEAREIALQAALLHPGDPLAAQQIAGISARVHTIQKAVQDQEDAEKDLQQKLEEAFHALEELTTREAALSKKSQNIVKRRRPAAEDEKKDAARDAYKEQDDVADGTEEVLEVVADARKFIQSMLAAAYGTEGQLPPTELDEPVELLKKARAGQKDALDNLKKSNLRWPQANSGILIALRRMQDVLRLLSSQAQGEESGEGEEGSDDEEADWEFEEDMEWSDEAAMSDMSMPMQAGEFNTDLDNNSLPKPNYTAEDVLQEEAANQEKRDKARSKRAGPGGMNW